MSNRLVRYFSAKWYFLSCYAIVLLVFLFNHWQIGSVPSILAQQVIALLLAIPLTLGLWFASQKRIPDLFLFFFYALFVALISLGLLEFTHQSTLTHDTQVFYGALGAIGLAACCTALLQQFVPYVNQQRHPRIGSFVFAILLLIFLGMSVPFFKASTTQVTESASPIDTINQADTVVLSNQKIYDLINAARSQHKIGHLSRQVSLESAAAQYLAQVDSQHLLGTDSDTTEIKKSVLQSADYPYYAVADILATITPTTTESEIVTRWLNDANISSVLLDNTYNDIGIATLAPKNSSAVGEVYIYAFVGTTKQPANGASPQLQQTKPAQPDPTFTGVDLFAAVNASRVRHGVNPLQQANPLCTVASIRLNEQLDLGKLDNHDGFQAVLDKYKDQLSQFSQISEDLAGVYPTANATVQAWEGSPGHLVLLKDGSYVWGCTAANHGFSVLIAAY